jgi:hypothetical protein
MDVGRSTTGGTFGARYCVTDLQYTTQNLNGQFHFNYIFLHACKNTEGTDDFEAFKMVKKGSKKKALGFAGGS